MRRERHVDLIRFSGETHCCDPVFNRARLRNAGTYHDIEAFRQIVGNGGHGDRRRGVHCESLLQPVADTAADPALGPVIAVDAIGGAEAYCVDSGSSTCSVLSGGNLVATWNFFDGCGPFACAIPEGLL